MSDPQPASALCPICKIHSAQPEGEFCRKCTEYVEQDYRYQRERITPVNEVEAFDGANLLGRPNKFLWADPQKPPDIPSLNTLIRKARLTRRQRAVLKLHFEESLSFFWIGEKLGISKDCAKARYRLAVKKLKKYYPKLLLVRGKDKVRN
jgi:DNA-directed RNA polymerase specialized sigma24 family protein